MDEKDFKEHLKDLAHGHHHPDEHDWPANGTVKVVDAPFNGGLNKRGSAGAAAKGKAVPKKGNKQKRTKR